MRVGNAHGGAKGRGASDAYFLDPLLLPRLEQYSHSNQLSNLDSIVEYLRRNYREYRRKQQGPFRKLVLKAVNILKKRLPEEAVLEERARRIDRGASAPFLHDGEEILQERETNHMMRFRLGSGHRDDELEAESLDNCSENSDGVESEGMSEGGSEGHEKEKKSLWIERIAGGKGSGKPGVDNKGKGPATGKRKLENRREGKDKETSDSEEELAFDGTEEEQPALGLLNASLRATYNGRPTLVLDTAAISEKNVISGSSSLYRFTTTVSADDKKRAQGESSKHGMSSSKGIEEPKRAFAPRAVVAEVARAALFKKSPKGPVIDQETKEAVGKGSANGAIAERDLCRGSPPAQSSGRPPQACRIRGKFPILSSPVLETGDRLQLNVKGIGEYRLVDEAKSLDRESIRTRESIGQVASTGKESGRSLKRKLDAEKLREGLHDAVIVEKGTFSSSTTPQNVCFKDLGGIEDTLEIIRNVIEYPLAHPELYEWLGVQPPRGVLLHGPPGCGKTMLANAIAAETRVPLLKISAPEVVSGMSGESEAKVRALFTEAIRLAPCIIFIDEIDAITPKRETAQREMERRIVAQLLTCMDDLNQPLSEKSSVSGKKRFGHVVVIGATNRPDALDPALRRAGRFDREIALGIPDENARARILTVLAQKLRLEGSFDFNHIARRTPGFVGADLAALTKEAAAVAVKRIFISRDPRGLLVTSPGSRKAAVGTLDVEKTGNSLSEDMQTDYPSTHGVLRSTRSLDSVSVCGDIGVNDGGQDLWLRPWTQGELDALSITMQDFEEAVGKVQPSAKREGFATIPDVTWDDVGSLGSVREELEFSISRPIKYPEEYHAMGLDMATGVLLYGPPGCGKTLVAKAIANEAGANFICVKGPELLNKYVGESERAVRQLFTRARASSPCVLFFDEMDAMAPRRGGDGNGAAERVVNQLLTEMDGLEQRKSIFLIGATNRPDMIDPALLRPGRLDKLLYVPLPDPQGRACILSTLVRKVPIVEDLDVRKIGESDRCDGFSGADLASLVREACIAALRERIMSATEVGVPHKQVQGDAPLVELRHFTSAFDHVFPSVSKRDRMRYDAICKSLRRARGHITNPNVDGDLCLPKGADCQ